MANSLEARSPLLDHKLVEFAARLPVERKIDGKTTKVLLRAIAKRLMPAAHIDRPKMGFAAPIGDWFRSALGDRFEELVLAPDCGVARPPRPDVRRGDAPAASSRRRPTTTASCGRC